MSVTLADQSVRMIKLRQKVFHHCLTHSVLRFGGSRALTATAQDGPANSGYLQADSGRTRATPSHPSPVPLPVGACSPLPLPERGFPKQTNSEPLDCPAVLNCQDCLMALCVRCKVTVRYMFNLEQKYFKEEYFSACSILIWCN